MNDGRPINGVINPLQLLEVDEPWASVTKAQPTPQSLLQFLCTPDLPCTVEAIVERYRAISREKVRLNMAPAEPKLLEKLVWPLRHAKASFIIGNYLGTIALGGMVAEMVAILFFEITGPRLNGQLMSPNDQRGLFGRTFEKLGQERRVEILATYRVISPPLRSDFDRIRDVRRKYLHLWSYEHATIQNDAIAVYQAAVALVVGVIGQDIRDGMFLLNPALLAYLERIGFISLPYQKSETGGQEGD